MNFKIKIFAITTVVLAASYQAFAQPEGAQAPMSQSVEQTDAVPAAALAPVPVTPPPAPAPLTPTTSAITAPLFNPQFGLGITGIIASGVLYPFSIESWSYYHGGIQLDVLWRIHPRVTLQFSPGILISDAMDQNNQRLIEVPLALGLRIHLRNLPKENRGVFLMPYVVGGFQMNFLFGAEPTYDDQSLYGYYTLPPSLYLGANLGAGIELRLHKQFTVHGEIRGFAQGPVDIHGYGVYLPPRLGIQLHIGLAVYF